MDNKVTKTNQSVDKMLDIVEILAKNGRPMRLSEISEAGGIPQSTVFRMVNALYKRGYVIQDINTSQYLLSPKFSLIGHLVSANIDIRNMAHPFMEKLSLEFDAVCYLGVPQGIDLVYIDMICPPMSVLNRLPFVGKHIPLFCGGIGRNILADYPDDQLRSYLQGVDKETLKENNMSVSDIEESVRQIRKDGYCCTAGLNQHHYAGNGSVSVGIRNFTGRVIAGISIGGPKEKMTAEYVEAVTRELKAAAEEISNLMAYKAL